MRRLTITAIFVSLAFTFACNSSSCSDSGGTQTAYQCPQGYTMIMSTIHPGDWRCVKGCPEGYVRLYSPEHNVYECIRNDCPEGQQPTWNSAEDRWECGAIPTATATPTSTASPTATADPTATATATPAPTATSSASDCFKGTWRGTTKSNIGWGDTQLTMLINQVTAAFSLLGTITQTSSGVTWKYNATGNVGSGTPPTSFKFGNSSESTFTGAASSCNKISGTYVDAHGDNGTFTATK